MLDEVQLRVRILRAGILNGVLLVGPGFAWVATTWSQPHRSELVGLGVLAAALTGLIALLPHERIVTSRYCEAFFLGWSLSLVGALGAAAALDSGVRSPAVLVLFLTQVYAALSYPRWSVAVVSVASLLVVFAVGQVPASRPAGAAYLESLMCILALTGTTCTAAAHFQHAARRGLAELSRTDALTGALNRLGLQERMARELARGDADPAGPRLGLVLLDLDGFKQVNDRRGHAAGDALLAWVARTITLALRPGDAFGRLGGDEFALLLPDVEPDEVAVIAERIQRALAPRIGVSVGTAIAAGDGEDADAETLYGRADDRLYADKRERAGVREPLRAIC